MTARPPRSPGQVEVRVLGPVDVLVDGVTAPAGGRNQRTALAVLAVRAGGPVSADALAAAVWGDSAADRSPGTLHVYVSNLRRALGGPDTIIGRPPGYQLAPEVSVDLADVTARVADGRRRLAEGDHAGAAAALRPALARWRGELGEDLGDVAELDGPRRTARELREGAAEDCAEAELALGRHRALLPELERACEAEPLRERRWAQLMLALYRDGRQSESLAAYQRARRILGAELGLEPGPLLVELQRLVLAQSPALASPADPGPALVWLDPGGPARAVALDPAEGVAITVGRAPGSHLALDADLEVSRRHAEVRFAGGGWWVHDEGWSANGTWLNGARVDGRAPLGDADLLRFGDTIVFVRLRRPEAAPGGGSAQTVVRDGGNR